MVQRVRKTISDHRKRLLPGFVALSLMVGVLVSIFAAPFAQADTTNGCGYGYGSSSGSTYGYGTGYGYGYVGGSYTYGYGDTIGLNGTSCPTTTTTAAPTTTTTTGGGTTTPPGGGTTTTTTAPTTTTTAPTTTTTKPAPSVRQQLRAIRRYGFGKVGRIVTMRIVGIGFYAQPRVTSTEPGTRVGVTHDYGHQLVLRVATRGGSPKGWHTFTIRVKDGRICKMNYLVK